MGRIWEEIVRIFRLDTSEPHYWKGHIVLLLLLCEIFFLISPDNARVETYNGSDFWFALIHYIIPYGTFPVSLVLMIWFGRDVVKAIRGIPTFGGMGGMDFMDKGGLQGGGGAGGGIGGGGGNIGFPPMGGMGFNWLAFARMIIEGLVIGFLLFKLLPQLTYFLLDVVMDGDVYIIEPLDANENMFHLHTSFLQNMAIAFCAGAYEELIFRKWLFEFLLKIAPRYITKTYFHLSGVIIVSSLIYAFSHYLYPVGDTLSTYSLMFRVFFGVIMCLVMHNRNLGVAAWTNAWYQLFYFAGA